MYSLRFAIRNKLYRDRGTISTPQKPPLCLNFALFHAYGEKALQPRSYYPVDHTPPRVLLQKHAGVASKNPVLTCQSLVIAMMLIGTGFLLTITTGSASACLFPVLPSGQTPKLAVLT